MIPDALDDSAARDLIRTALDRTLFVEAGAGSGKTSELVARVGALVRSGVRLRDVAAITFTEKAAAELRHRVRVTLLEAGDQQAIADLDSAAIGTLHSFAQRILTDHAVEAGLPPRIEVLDEIASQLAFDARWRDFLDELLDDAVLTADPALERVLVFAREVGVTLEHLRQLAVRFANDWDLVQVWLTTDDATRSVETNISIDVDDIVVDLRALAARRHVAHRDDRYGAHLATLEVVANALETSDEIGRIRLLGEDVNRYRNYGQAKLWGANGKEALADVKAAVGELAERIAARRGQVLDICLRRLALAIGRFTLAAAGQRRAEGRLEFHDLLVMSRAVLRHPAHGPAVRAALHDRYRRLLLDEFQDTDPIQIELAVLIAADPDEATNPQPVPGRLFFVGDPKQSIYRFRRADIATFLRARDDLDVERVALTTNFRTVLPVLAWINHVFGELIQPIADTQPAYEALTGGIELPAGRSESAVVVLGGCHDDNPPADELRRREATDVALAVRHAMGELVRDNGVGTDTTWRPARLSDVAILIPTRTSLVALETALTAAGVSFRTESSSLVYATREIRDLLMAARAVDDPSDEFAVVSALRSRVFACSDLQLAVHARVHRGSWNPMSAPPPAAPDDDPVVAALDQLRQLHVARHWLTPSEILARIAEEHRLFELGAIDGRHRDAWRRLRFVIDQARAWSDAGGVTLRDYLIWTRRQSDEGARVAEAVLPETDDDAVRIMTIHAAKGLEFPIVIVAGMTTKPQSNLGGVRVAWRGGIPQVSIRKDVTTIDFDAARELDDQMDHHERLRLLYVACTRARDHLVVSLHHTAAHAGAKPQLTPAGALLATASCHSPNQRPLSVDAVAPAPTPTPRVVEPIDEASWRHALATALGRAGRPGTMSATSLAMAQAANEVEAGDPGLDKDGLDLDLPPWNKGRYGTAVGRAVHAVLQSADLRTGADIDDAAAAQAVAEGVVGKESIIADLARSALRSNTVRSAVSHRYWRELYVAAPIAGRLLEGFVDLLYRGPDGLVVVDYKTDRTTDDADIDERAARYRLQGAAYALAVEHVTGEPVVACTFVFCSLTEPRERSIPDLAAAMESVRVALAADHR